MKTENNSTKLIIEFIQKSKKATSQQIFEANIVPSLTLRQLQKKLDKMKHEGQLSRWENEFKVMPYEPTKNNIIKDNFKGAF